MYWFKIFTIQLLLNNTYSIYSFLNKKDFIKMHHTLNNTNILLSNPHYSSNLFHLPFVFENSSKHIEFNTTKKQKEILFSGLDNRTCINEKHNITQIANLLKNKIILDELENPHISIFQKLEIINTWNINNSNISKYTPNLLNGGLLQDW